MQNNLIHDRSVLRPAETTPAPARSVARGLAYCVGLSAAIGIIAMPAVDAAASELNWKLLPALPDAEGFAGMFAGTSDDAFVLAGGANFTDKRPWEGGVKQWYDTVWLLETPTSAWRQVGHLPHAIAYGVSASTSAGLICAGGGNAGQHFRDVYRLAWRAGRVQFERLAALPQPCSFAAGALVGNTLYISGGIERPDSTHCLHTLWALDLNRADAGWSTLEPCPGPERMLAVAGVSGDDFYLFSGQRLSPDPPNRPAREFLRDAWRYRPGQGWQRLADLPRAAVAAPTPAPRLVDGRLLIMTGDDGANITFKPETRHPGFPRDVLAFDPATDRWSTLGQTPFSRATVPTASWHTMTIIPSGEARPGYRSPEVWALTASSP
jgi:N-acetylneuraminate epimerase